MNRTSTKAVSFENLKQRGETAIIVIRLMMAGNDLALANECLALFSADQPPLKRHRQMGARLYFLNLQLGHLAEAMDVLQDVSGSEELMNLVDRCDDRTKAEYIRLTQYLGGGAKRQEFEKYVIQVRSNLAFHYAKSGKQVRRAVEDRAGRPDGRMSSITRGSDSFLWRFNVADDVVDSIVCRQIWAVPRSKNDRDEINKVADFAYQACLSFMAFVGEFTWRYCGAV